MIQSIYNEKNAHCSYCGGLFLDQKWPRTCLICSNITYVNPIPIAVSLIPVWNNRPSSDTDSVGLLLVRRANEPKVGEWAFPGGYIELGETWQQGAARELKEEINLDVLPGDLEYFTMENATSGNLLIFNVFNKLLNLSDIKFKPNSEVSEIGISRLNQELAFPIHTKILKEYIEQGDKLLNDLDRASRS